MALAPHQQRVVTEREELDEKITKLTAFTDTDIFRSLDKAEQERLERQLSHMNAYSDVLGERIGNF